MSYRTKIRAKIRRRVQMRNNRLWNQLWRMSTNPAAWETIVREALYPRGVKGWRGYSKGFRPCILSQVRDQERMAVKAGWKP